MKIVRNSILPFSGYKAINLFGILFVRKKAIIGSIDINHESIHTAQMKEMLYIPYYIWYGIEWLIRFMCCLGNKKAYRLVGFEQEAYTHEQDMQYLQNRKHFCWFTYIVS